MTKRVSVREGRACGRVTISTVSRVLNGSGLCEPGCAPARAAGRRQLGYEADYGAPPAHRHSRTIGCLLPSIANPFVAQLLSEVERPAGGRLFPAGGQFEQRSRDKGAGGVLREPAPGGHHRLARARVRPHRRLALRRHEAAHGHHGPRHGPVSMPVLIDHEPACQVMDYLLSPGACGSYIFAIGDKVKPG